MKVIKKIALLAFASAMALSFAACGDSDKKNTSSQPVSQTDTAVDVKDYTGTFMADRCVMTVEAEDEKNVRILVEWGGGFNELERWEMTGWFDPDTFRVVYSDCTETTVKFDDDNRESKTIVYTDGSGRIQFRSKDELVWMDEQHPDYADLKFTRS